MQPISSIAIVGGGTTGWIAAAVLANELQGRCQVTLIESAEIGTIGVGESTIPPFLDLLRNLDIDENDFIAKTNASFKLGIDFQNWQKKNHSYFHPFGFMNAGMDEYTFYQSWLKHRLEPGFADLQSFVVNSEMAKAGKFIRPDQAGNTPLADTRYALHINAKDAAAYFREYAESRGVRRVEGKVVQVHKAQQGGIESLQLASGQLLAADFFIDCTGFYALLIEKTLGVGYVDWSEYLPCDRAVTVQTSGADNIAPYTIAKAQPAGWQWGIPLQNCLGNGYVYASNFCSDDEARATLLANIEGECLNDPMVIPFKTGRREEFWHENCVCLGLAAGFIEPLESTAIHLAARGVVHLMRNFPRLDTPDALRKQFNRCMQKEYEEVLDFIVLHYCLTQRTDTEFWRWCQTMPLPPSLRTMLEYFNVYGGIPETVDPLFGAVAWRSVCEGMGLRPVSYDPLLDGFDADQTVQHLKKFQQLLSRLVQQLPSHRQYLDASCSHGSIQGAPRKAS